MGVDAVLSVSPANQTYLAGFRALLYSRPILLFLTTETTELVVPGLEEAHAREEASFDALHVYYEHPDGAGPDSALDWLDELLRRQPSGATVGIEATTCPVAVAQRVVASGRPVRDLDDLLVSMREVKDDVELGLIRVAARVVEAGVAAAMEACQEGATEIEVDGAGTTAVLSALSRMDAAVTLEELMMTPSGTARSVLPHVFSTTRRLRRGDGLIHTRQVGLAGYRAELERTAFIGSPSASQRRAFDAMRRAQAAAIATVRAGARCSDIDRAARGVFVDAGLGGYAIHRTGHGIGLSPHEPPYLRYDNPQPLRERAVITIEPGIYVPGLGGFRHSDTLLVLDGGAEVLTEHATDLAVLTREGQRPDASV